MVELRCDSKLHGLLVDGLIEIKCDSKFCGHEKGATVLHRFDPLTGSLVETQRFKDPAVRKENQHAANNDSAAVRSA